MNLLAAGFQPSKEAFQPQAQRFSPLRRSTDKNGGTSGGAGISIAPQSEYVSFLPNQFSQEQWQRALKGEIAPIIDGMLDYCDEFGNYSCRWFSLFWEGPPEKVFIETTEISCNNLYGYPPAQPGQTYLLPCEQPKEREEREKQERQNMIEAAAKAEKASPLATATTAPK
jgi:hypothetical protein